jgi:GDPmannose 4,6-dehydratase
MVKKALITGITGQDGSYLAELLLSKGYEVHGLVRRASSPNTSRIEQYASKVKLHHGDLSDSDQIIPIMCNIKPDEVYNLAAQSHVGISFDMPEYTSNITGLGTTRLLEAIRKNNPAAKFYQASSSEMFGAAPPPQYEITPFHPLSPYSCSKLYSYWMVHNYRDAYNLFALNGILFNHESPRRGEIFVTRKITLAIANILAKKQKFLELGNLDAKRDWGFAPEYVEVMWKMLQQEKPADYVIGTGETHTVEEFVDEAFKYAGLDPEKCIRSGKEMFRPTDVRVLRAGIGKAQVELGWKPKIKFYDLIKVMVDADMRNVGLEPIGDGDKIIKKRFPNRWWQKD